MANSEYPSWYPGALAALDNYPRDEEQPATFAERYSPFATRDSPPSDQAAFGRYPAPRTAVRRDFGSTEVAPLASAIGDIANKYWETVKTPGSLLWNEPQNRVEPAVPGYWSDEDEARAAATAGRLTLTGMATGLETMNPLARPVPGMLFTGGAPKARTPQPVMGELAAPFYSAAEQAVTGAKQAAAPGPQWLGTLRNAPGVKPEELQRLGIEPWLAGQQGPVSKQALADYIAANKTNVGEVTKGANPMSGLYMDGIAQRMFGRSYAELPSRQKSEVQSLFFNPQKRRPNSRNGSSPEARTTARRCARCLSRGLELCRQEQG